MGEGRGWIEERAGDGVLHLHCGGRWSISEADRLDQQLREAVAKARERGEVLALDLEQVEVLDTAGAWLVHRSLRDLRSAGGSAELAGLRPEHRLMLEEVRAADQRVEIRPLRPWTPARVVAHIGKVTVSIWQGFLDLLAFFGAVVEACFGILRHPSRLRLTSTVFHMEEVGFNALPIVGLISLLIGVVLAYQGAIQLEQFGAEIFVVDLLAISVLRELGVLLTSIVIAGRSGSAFTAQLGSMKVREEVDALETLGIDPLEVLVLPRLFALMLTLPLLTFFADLMGLLGGALMSWIGLEVSPALFLDRLQATTGSATGQWHFWVGMIKAPVFALLIALIGCYEGLEVRGSAESVGQHTTKSVVKGIFMVIVVDAFFSIFFSLLGF